MKRFAVAFFVMVSMSLTGLKGKASCEVLEYVGMNSNTLLGQLLQKSGFENDRAVTSLFETPRWKRALSSESYSSLLLDILRGYDEGVLVESAEKVVLDARKEAERKAYAQPGLFLESPPAQLFSFYSTTTVHGLLQLEILFLARSNPEALHPITGVFASKLSSNETHYLTLALKEAFKTLGADIHKDPGEALDEGLDKIAGGLIERIVRKDIGQHEAQKSIAEILKFDQIKLWQRLDLPTDRLLRRPIETLTIAEMESVVLQLQTISKAETSAGGLSLGLKPVVDLANQEANQEVENDRRNFATFPLAYPANFFTPTIYSSGTALFLGPHELGASGPRLWKVIHPVIRQALNYWMQVH